MKNQNWIALQEKIGHIGESEVWRAVCHHDGHETEGCALTTPDDADFYDTDPRELPEHDLSGGLRLNSYMPGFKPEDENADLWYQVIEDNGGGLALFILGAGNEVIYGATDYEYRPGALTKDIKAFMYNGDVSDWEQQTEPQTGDEIDMQAIYDDYDNHARGWEIVAYGDFVSQKEIRWPDKMGAAAREEFIDIDWADLDLTASDGQDLEGNAAIAKLREFRATGGMRDVFFQPLGLPHEDPNDASTHGPESPLRVDWTGFPKVLTLEEFANLCERGPSRTEMGEAASYILVEQHGKEIFYAEWTFSHIKDRSDGTDGTDAEQQEMYREMDTMDDEQTPLAYQAYLNGDREYTG